MEVYHGKNRSFIEIGEGTKEKTYKVGKEILWILKSIKKNLNIYGKNGYVRKSGDLIA